MKHEHISRNIPNHNWVHTQRQLECNKSHRLINTNTCMNLPSVLMLTCGTKNEFASHTWSTLVIRSDLRLKRSLIPSDQLIRSDLVVLTNAAACFDPWTSGKSRLKCPKMPRRGSVAQCPAKDARALHATKRRKRECIYIYLCRDRFLSMQNNMWFALITWFLFLCDLSNQGFRRCFDRTRAVRVWLYVLQVSLTRTGFTRNCFETTWNSNTFVKILAWIFRL